MDPPAYLRGDAKHVQIFKQEGHVGKPGGGRLVGREGVILLQFG